MAGGPGVPRAPPDALRSRTCLFPPLPLTKLSCQTPPIFYTEINSVLPHIVTKPAPKSGFHSQNMSPHPLRYLDRLLSRWEPILSTSAWYLTVIPDMEAFNQSIENESVEIKSACKNLFYDFFEAHLIRGDIALSRKREDADEERQPIDTVVIHHTSSEPGLRPERLSAIELIRLYAPYFAVKKDQFPKGQPIYSGHLRDGRQVFWPYHWIVRSDGNAERLLFDSEVGWHVGNWEINCRSVAIVLDNDYELESPSNVELHGVAAVIREHYGQIPLTRIVGHREVNPKTACPSELFLDKSGWKGWKSTLLGLLAN